MSFGRRLTSAGLPAPFDQDEVVVHRQALYGTLYAAAHGLVLRRVEGADNTALHDDLRAPICLRLQEYRVEVVPWLQSGGTRLQCLRTSDLAAVDADRGVVRHVLRLERRDADAAPPGEPAESRHDDRLADA